MRPTLSMFIKTSAYRSKWVGVRWQLIISFGVIWFAAFWLRKEYGQVDSNLWLVMNQFIELIKWALIGLLVISFITVFSTWLYFLQKRNNQSLQLQVRFGDGQKAEAGWVPLMVTINGPVLRPLLGSIQAQLLFTEKKISDKIILDSNVHRPKHWWRQGIRGTGQTYLNDRGIYDVEKVLLSFCDMLGLFSLPCTIPFTQQLYTLPRQEAEQKIKAQPNSTEIQKHRIEVPKRVEGELVNYKEFETGDNIQRIVWKIYAKSGQLVVRIPEIKDPYASHLYFYVSYFHGFNMSNGAFEVELLNFYKDKVRSFFEAISKNGYDVRIPPDQEIPKLSGLGEKKIELFQITAASWQNQLSPVQFINYSKAAFVCLSSLTPISEIESIIKKLPLSIPLVVVKLSEAIPSPFKITAKDIFFKPAPQPVDKLRQPWLLSSLRRNLKENEAAIDHALQQRGNAWLTNNFDFER